MILKTWSTMLRQTGDYIGPSGFWSQSQNRRWVLTLSLSAAATHTTEYTSALAKSCITGASRESCAADRWKRLLSLGLRSDAPRESQPVYHRNSDC